MDFIFTRSLSSSFLYFPTKTAQTVWLCRGRNQLKILPVKKRWLRWGEVRGRKWWRGLTKFITCQPWGGWGRHQIRNQWPRVAGGQLPSYLPPLPILIRANNSQTRRSADCGPLWELLTQRLREAQWQNNSEQARDVDISRPTSGDDFLPLTSILTSPHHLPIISRLPDPAARSAVAATNHQLWVYGCCCFSESVGSSSVDPGLSQSKHLSWLPAWLPSKSPDTNDKRDDRLLEITENNNNLL